MLLVDEVKKRTQFLNNYIGNLSKSISKRHYNQALNFISQQRPVINHTNVTNYNPNSIVIDALRTKNQNLIEIRKQLQKQKALLQKRLNQQSKNSAGVTSLISDSNITATISKIPISLKDIKRVQFQPIQLDSDYQKLKITNSQGKQTTLNLLSIRQIQKKSLYMLLSCLEIKDNNQHKLWVIIKFQYQHQFQKWSNAISYGRIVQQAKNKRYLFIQSQNYNHQQPGKVQRKPTLNDQSEVFPYLGKIPSQITAFRGTFVPEKPISASSIKRQPQNFQLFDKESQKFTTKELQKQMTTSLLISPSDNMSVTKKPIHNYSTFRPTPLNRIRGKSMYLEIERGRNLHQYRKQAYYNNYQDEKGDFFDNRSQRQQKSNNKNNFRKASEDITLRPKKPSSQQRKLQKFRSQRNLAEEILIQSAQVRQQHNNPYDKNYQSTYIPNNFPSGHSKRIDKQIQKKNEFLQRINTNFKKNNGKNIENNSLKNSMKNMSQQNKQQQQSRKQLQTTARWFTEEDMQSQSIKSKKSQKSQLSHNNMNDFPKKILYNKQNKELFEEQFEYSLQDQSLENYKDKGHKIINNFIQNHQEDEIIQASQSHEISPTFPKKIVYEDGSHIRLYPVQHTDSKNQSPNKLSEEKISNKNSKNNLKTDFSGNRNHEVEEQKNTNFIQSLQQMQENDYQQSRHEIRNDRLNTLDSETDKDQHNHTNQINESNSEDHQEEQFQQLIEDLKKGLILTKCSENSFWTREKQIKLSENQNTLLIIDVKDKKIKKIPISDIESAEYGKFSKGIIKHIPQIQEKKCLIINVKQGKLIKKIQFVGNNPQKLSVFTENLAYFIQMFKAS